MGTDNLSILTLIQFVAVRPHVLRISVCGPVGVFILGSAGSRRLTNFGGYVRDFGIASSAQSVAIVTESKEKPAKAELLLWNAGGGPIRKLQCGSSVEERALVP
jgi:hypothetical protein